MKKIVFVVGHENWGKSKTLKAMTDNNRYIRKCKIGGHEWFIRRMSNDDQPAGYYDFMRKFNGSHLIAAFCPNFDEERHQKTTNLLMELKERGYELYFWILKKQFTSSKEIASNYIEKLNMYGVTEVHNENNEAVERANKLRKFIIKSA